MMTTEKINSSFPVAHYRQDFPILRQRVNGKPLIYLDNAATSQKPALVIEALKEYYETYNANVHRGVHYLSEWATSAYEAARVKAQQFINAKSAREIVFVRGTTEGINLVAHSFGRLKIKANDEIVITEMEHHSNIVPWQLLCEYTGAKLKVVPINDAGEISLEDYQGLLSEKTKLVAVTHISNALGTINPIEAMIKLAHAHDIPVLIDGAQATPHLQVDVQQLDCDFYVFSSHKMFGPTGVGVLYGKERWLEAMPPYQGGGEMISQVTFAKTTFHELPYKFEAGTPNIEGVIGLAKAIDYINGIGLAAINAYEHELLLYATLRAQQEPDVRLIGTAKHKASILSFELGTIHPHDIGTILDQEGIAIRTGHHCAMPVMEHFGVPATARASFAFYNTKAEIDALFAGLKRVREIFK